MYACERITRKFPNVLTPIIPCKVTAHNMLTANFVVIKYSYASYSRDCKTRKKLHQLNLVNSKPHIRDLHSYRLSRAN